MKKLLLPIYYSSHLLFSMGNDNVNYDEEFDRVDESMSAKEEVEEDIFKEPEPIPEPDPTPMPKLDKSQILSKLKIETYTFREKNGNNEIAVKYVPKNSSVIYLNSSCKW